MNKNKVIVVETEKKNNLKVPQNIQIIGCLNSSRMAEKQLLEELKLMLAKGEVNAFWVDECLNEEKPNIIYALNKVGVPILNLNNYEVMNSKARGKLLKRLIDITISLIGLILAALVGVAIFPIVHKQSPGSIIFVQDRVGKNGKRFKIYKFRSMYLDAEKRKKDLMEQNEIGSDLMFKLENDPRVFPFGQKMRSWSIDELPQFYNVLKGDMSLIGTRPPTLEEVSRYELHHFKRLAMKPGITGMWQVSGRSNIKNFEEVVKLDAFYIDNWSIWLDLKIILKTIKVVLLKEGSK